MPPYLPGTGPGEPPGSNRHEANCPERPAGQVGRQFGRRPADSVPPPLPENPHVRRPQPWPLQHRVNTNAEPNLHEASEFPPATDEARDAQPRANSQRRFTAVGYTTLGFLAGAVFWHAVGFWTLVHEAVFSGPRSEASAYQNVPVVAAPRAVAFDEEKLRDHARRSTSVDVWRNPQNITTGSISAPNPSPATSAKTQLQNPAPSESQKADPRLVTGPGETSWQPAVSRAP